MLAAIVPHDARAWFFKVVGPQQLVDAKAEELTKFFASVRFEGERPMYALPEGWKEERGSGMRAATIIVPTAGKSLEIGREASITSRTASSLNSGLNCRYLRGTPSPFGSDHI